MGRSCVPTAQERQLPHRPPRDRHPHAPGARLPPLRQPGDRHFQRALAASRRRACRAHLLRLHARGARFRPQPRQRPVLDRQRRQLQPPHGIALRLPLLAHDRVHSEARHAGDSSWEILPALGYVLGVPAFVAIDSARRRGDDRGGFRRGELPDQFRVYRPSVAQPAVPLHERRAFHRSRVAVRPARVQQPRARRPPRRVPEQHRARQASLRPLRRPRPQRQTFRLHRGGEDISFVRHSVAPREGAVGVEPVERNDMAIQLSNYFGRYFVNECKYNENRFESLEVEDALLLHNWVSIPASAIHKVDLEVSMPFTEIYCFDRKRAESEPVKKLKRFPLL